MKLLASMAIAPEPTLTNGTKAATVDSFTFHNEDQHKAFTKFKSLCEENHLYWPASELESHPNNETNDDITLMYVNLPLNVRNKFTILDDSYGHARGTRKLRISNTVPPQSGVANAISTQRTTTPNSVNSNA